MTINYLAELKDRCKEEEYAHIVIAASEYFTKKVEKIISPKNDMPDISDVQGMVQDQGICLDKKELEVLIRNMLGEVFMNRQR